MWLTFCEGLQKIGNSWGMVIMMIGIVYLVTEYQKWTKAADMEFTREMNDIVICEEEIEDDDGK